MFHSDAIGPFWHLLDGHFELFRNDRQGVCHVVVRVARQRVHHRRLDVVVVIEHLVQPLAARGL